MSMAWKISWAIKMTSAMSLVKFKSKLSTNAIILLLLQRSLPFPSWNPSNSRPSIFVDRKSACRHRKRTLTILFPRISWLHYSRHKNNSKSWKKYYILNIHSYKFYQYIILSKNTRKNIRCIDVGIIIFTFSMMMRLQTSQ